MTLKAWLIIGLELLLSILIIYILFGQISKETRRADAAESLAKQRQETITDMTTRQRDVAALDAKYTKELADAKAENDALQRKLDNGGRVLVKGKSSVPVATQTTGAASMGDDATVELSSVAGRNVLGIRSGIISDQKSLSVLQDYIRTQCIK
ncbi:lysis protein [Citrobacter sp. Igbk 16]|uniref:lysis protein n=1 Tax=Citrobacter sp. Igbk 16 TaxID=2963958 RepID=UPI002304BE3B|nr:lysis protein [Citrobacter sp. Igbk 16]MDA8515626.1 lysis protein [Citrobacter sp. Igbk 16]